MGWRGGLRVLVRRPLEPRVRIGRGARRHAKRRRNFSTGSSTSSTRSPSTSEVLGRIEIQGRHRHREEQGFNQDVTGTPGWWSEGENYVALRMAPKWVFTAGLRVHDAHRAAEDVREQRGALQVHEQLEPALLRRRAARSVPMCERDLPLLSGVRGGKSGVDAAVLASIARRSRPGRPLREDLL